METRAVGIKIRDSDQGTPLGVLKRSNNESAFRRWTRQHSAAESDNAVIAALQARLEAIERELLRVANLACRTEGRDQQDKYWELAKQLQRDAREIRAEITARLTKQSDDQH